MESTSKVPFRSISLPSRLHPINQEFELQKLKSLQVSSSSKAEKSISSQDIQSSLVGVAELYNSVEEMITKSPSTQKSISLQLHHDEKSIDGLSVELLDSCNNIREIFQMIKENIHALQSALRRKGLDSSIEKDINTYFCFRKKMNKCIAKSLKSLKSLENKKNISVNADSNFVSVLGELTGAAVAVLKGILAFLAEAMGKPRGWSLVSKVMLAKYGRETNAFNEVNSVDFALSSLQGKASCDLQMLQRSLQNFVESVEGLEEGLDRLFRELVRSRVTILNILTDI